MTSFGNRVFAEVINIKIRTRSFWIRVGPKSNKMEKNRATGKKATGKRRQRLEPCCHKPRVAKSPQDLGEAWEGPPPELLQRAKPC